MSTSDENDPRETEGTPAEPLPEAGKAAAEPGATAPEAAKPEPATAAPTAPEAATPGTTGTTAGAGRSEAAAEPAAAASPAQPAASRTPAAAPPPAPAPPAQPPVQPPAAGLPSSPTLPAPAPLPVRPPLPSPAPADEAAARHAVVRPTPVPPGPASAPGLPQRVPTRGAPAGATPGLAGAPTAPLPPTGASATPSPSTPTTPQPAAATAAGLAATAAGTAASAPVTAAALGEAPTPAKPGDQLFPDPNAPRTITVGAHVLGVLVGLLLPLAAVLVTLLGNSRILAAEADGWIASVEILGIVLVTLGALLLAACALLSLWTPTVGLVGGTLLTLAGGLALYAPGLVRTWVLDLLESEAWRPTVVQTVVSATSGVLVVAGVLLLASGVVSSVARHHGIRLGAFRERHRA